MKPIKTENTNAIFTKEGCFDLPGTKYLYEDGTTGIETVWELSKEEMEKVVENGKIYLYMQGETVPPMFMTVESAIEFDEREGVDNVGGG